ncbi:amidohydrolase family protein [Pseudaminobacter sp. NGMCC 1.201702]|uniref:amidohydrolase family protein n=1 Tax=Pseudaminobacter sp. NGMCC 1.201702 TaxID=3391825 RepID=UPI0039EEF966
MTSILLKHGTIVTMDSKRSIINDGAVLVDGNKIVAVGDAAYFHNDQAEEVIDCSGKVIIPGLIDAHGHAGHSLIKTLGSDTPYLWMRIVTPAYFHFTTPEFWLADGYVSALDRLRMGVTCGLSVISSCPRSDDPTFAINHARAYREVGIREIISTGPAGLPWPHPVTRWRDNVPSYHLVSLDEMLAGAEAVIESCNGAGNGLIRAYLTPFTITPSVDPSNPSTPDRATTLTQDDRDHGRRVKELACKLGVRIHSDAFGGMIRMAWQDPESAILGPNVHLQHCIGISLEEVEILAQTGTNVTHSPGGAAPILQMMTRGITVAITTDGTAPQSNFDLFQAARQVQMAHRLLEGDPYLLPPGKLLEMITIDAAKTLGLDKEIGSIEVGKKADLAILNMRQPHLVPNWMVVHRLVLQAVGRDVDKLILLQTFWSSRHRSATDRRRPPLPTGNFKIGATSA